MKYEKKDDGTTHVYVENAEGEFEVLRAIVQATFDSAVPVGMGFLHYDASHKMNRNQAESLINKTDWDIVPASVVSMDYVAGRQVKTYIKRLEKNHFGISTRTFERDRGDISAMLDLANETILKERNSGEKVVSVSMFIGENLDKRLAEYGFKRNLNEKDWDFRKRIFPTLYAKTKGDPRAIEFLYGKSAKDWNDVEGMLSMAVGFDQSPQGLKKFADDFADDPLVMFPLK